MAKKHTSTYVDARRTSYDDDDDDNHDDDEDDEDDDDNDDDDDEIYEGRAWMETFHPASSFAF